jgi:hypothetical protein
MFVKGRWICVASAVSLFLAGCGGSGTSTNISEPDANADGNTEVVEGGGTPDANPSNDANGDDEDANGTTPDANMNVADATPDAADSGQAVADGGDAGDGGGSMSNPDGGSNGVTCSGNGDCLNGHCVSGICCASACTSPSTCHSATGATCSGGATCTYPNASDNTTCDDGNACTTGDSCQSGTCTGGGTNSCDDGNPCTTDTCNSSTGCAHDGTGVTTSGCKTGDMCTGYVCAGDSAGTCKQVTLVDCSASGDQCNNGVCNPTTGACSPQPTNEGLNCQDNNACTVGETCQSGSCTGGTPLNCDTGNPCTTGTCDTVLGCRTANVPAGTTSCTDGNPCTVNDTCSGGLCAGSPMDCSGQSDQCNVGVCNGGTCGKSPLADNTACNDTLACTTTDVCTGGQCKGSGNSCGANSSGCAEGPPKSCTCNAGFLSSGGQCVPNVCSSNACVAGATCSASSSAPSGYVCTCPTGFTGDGTTSGTGCTSIACQNNPCGAGLGTCVPGSTSGSYTCNCDAGYVSVTQSNGEATCVCDMSGTFASQYSLTTSLPATLVGPVTVFSAETNVPTTQWALRTQTYDSSGNLVIKTTQCGGTTADLCGVVTGLKNAFTAFYPGPMYDLASMPVTQSNPISIPNALPGQAYAEPQSATLMGISLTNPLGAWPASSTNVGAGSSQTNGAVWVDNDNDTFPGVTSYVVPPGGISETTSPFPIENYPSTSSECGTAYAYFPSFGTGGAIKRLYSAQRMISSMSGTISTCDSTGATLITGTLGGPDSNEPKVDGRVDGCVQVNGTGEIACSSSTASTYDGQSQTQHITGANFVLKRVTSGTTCEQVRAMSFN